MFPFILLMLALVGVYLGANVTALAIKNRKAHQFFKIKTPNLPVLPYCPLFLGNLKDLVTNEINYRLYVKLHEKYGPTFGFYLRDSPYVATTDLDLIKIIEVDQAHKHINRSVWGVPVDEFHHSIFQVCDDEWRNVRRAVAPALTNLKVKSQEVMEGIEHTMKKFEKALSKKFEIARAKGEDSIVINVEDFMERYALAIIFLLTYKRDDIDFESETDYWTHTIHESAERVKHPVLIYGTAFPFARPLAKFLIKFTEVGRAPNRLNKFVKGAVTANMMARKDPEKAKEDGFKRTLIDYLIESYLERKIKKETFFATGAFMIMAGFETTATTLTGLIWQLARDSTLQEKLRTAVLEDGIDCDYVTWTIYETVRWLPAVISATGRVLGEDLTVNGTFLPKGTFVMPSTYAIHMDPKIWPEPEKFIPERFSDSTGRHPAAFLGFGLGPRNCVGAKLAIQEIRMIISFLITNYRIESCEETPEKFEFTAPGCLWLNLDRPIMVKLSPLQKA